MYKERETINAKKSKYIFSYFLILGEPDRVA